MRKKKTLSGKSLLLYADHWGIVPLRRKWLILQWNSKLSSSIIRGRKLILRPILHTCSKTSPWCINTHTHTHTPFEKSMMEKMSSSRRRRSVKKEKENTCIHFLTVSRACVTRRRRAASLDRVKGERLSRPTWVWSAHRGRICARVETSSSLWLSPSLDRGGGGAP